MKAMVLTKPEKIENSPLIFSDVTYPEIIQENELLIRIKFCGVCRSNLHLIEGDWLKYGFPPSLPIIPGHEIVGEIEKINGTNQNFSIGQRVGLNPLYNTCQNCEFCKNNRENLCLNADFTGETTNGGYAEYIRINEKFVTPLPDYFDSETATPLFCPGITAFKAVESSGVTNGKTIGVFGVGGVGHLAIQFAKLKKARVVGLSRNTSHLDLAKKLGADNVFNTDSNTSELLKKIKREEGLLDYALVFAPSEEIIDMAISSVKSGGTIVLGVFGKISSFLFTEEKIIKGTLTGTMRDISRLLEVVENSGIKMITKTFALREANDALKRLKHSEIDGRAVLKI